MITAVLLPGGGLPPISEERRTRKFSAMPSIGHMVEYFYDAPVGSWGNTHPHTVVMTARAYISHIVWPASSDEPWIFLGENRG